MKYRIHLIYILANIFSILYIMAWSIFLSYWSEWEFMK